MLGVKLPFKIESCEDAAYKLAEEVIAKGFSADVKRIKNYFCTIIHKQHLIHNVIGTPTVIIATFFDLEDGTGIEVKEGSMELCLQNVVKEVALYALLIPGIIKRIDAVKMEKKIMRKSLIVVKKMRIAEQRKAGEI